MKRIDAKKYSTLSEYIIDSKEKGLTHIVVDGKQQPKFLNDVFFDAQKFPYLIKEYDSQDKDYQYHVKIYKIDYEKFNEKITEI